jgi:serine/threonine protein kinase
MPASLAVRGEGPRITIRSKAHEKTYAMGLRSFVNEARLLAKFDHPSLVKVYRFWEDNGTAYMVMPYLQGITLRDKRKTMGAPPKEAWLRQILDPMLEALEQLHGEGIYHRDIAPDNIFLPISGGAPILLDFGAARQVISDRTQTLTAILKPSYAPIEQYADTGMRQGAWTDLYALGAVMHFLLFATPPAPSTARAMQGDAVPIDQRRVPGVSSQFMSVIAWMLGVRPTDRPQSVAALRAVLRGEAEVPEPVSVKREAPASAAPASAQAYEQRCSIRATSAPCRPKVLMTRRDWTRRINRRCVSKAPMPRRSWTRRTSTPSSRPARHLRRRCSPRSEMRRRSRRNMLRRGPAAAGSGWQWALRSSSLPRRRSWRCGSSAAARARRPPCP